MTDEVVISDPFVLGDDFAQSKLPHILVDKSLNVLVRIDDPTSGMAGRSKSVMAVFGSNGWNTQAATMMKFITTKGAKLYVSLDQMSDAEIKRYFTPLYELLPEQTQQRLTLPLDIAKHNRETNSARSESFADMAAM